MFVVAPGRPDPARPVPGVAEEFVVQKGGGSSRSQIEHVPSGRRYYLPGGGA